MSGEYSTGYTSTTALLYQHNMTFPPTNTTVKFPASGQITLNMTTSTPFTTHEGATTTSMETASSWTVDELKILGAVLWVVIVFSLVGNLACFYAVIRNLKALLEHPFFQSNMFCVYLSFVDILLVALVGIPAALSYTMPENSSLRNSIYNLAVANPLLDFAVWLQLLLVVAICVDRAGHICRPLRYTYNITAFKAVSVLVTCTSIPFLALILPYIVATHSTIDYFSNLNLTSPATVALTCDHAREFDENGIEKLTDRNIFLMCILVTSNDIWKGFNSWRMWMNVAYPLLMLLAVIALALTSGIIIYKLNKSAKMQKDNLKRQDEVAVSIRRTCTVSLLQALLILLATLPLRWYQIDDSIHASCVGEECRGAHYSSHYILISRVLVFLGPMLNPWLYPIRMASIRSFLITKKKTIASSVNTNFTKFRTTLSRNQSERHPNPVSTKLLSETSYSQSATDKNQSTVL